MKISDSFRLNKFGRNLLVSVAGSGLSYVMGFLFTPFITRIYAPEAYGVFALINNLTLSLSLLACLGLRGAYMLPRTMKGFKDLVGVSMILTLSFCLLFLILDFFFGEKVARFFNADSAINYLWIIPVFILLDAVFRVSQVALHREQKFRRTSIAQMVAVVSSKGSTLYYGIWLGSSVFGLLIGEISYKVFGLSVQMVRSRRLLKFISLLVKTRWIDLKAILHLYRKYPMYILPSDWIGILIAQLPFYSISALYDSQTAGYFALTNSLLMIPLQVIGYSSSSVFFQRATQLKDDRKSLNEYVQSFTYKFIGIAFLPFLVLTWFGEPIFTIVLGAEWTVSGEFAEILGCYYMLQMIVVPIYSIFKVISKEKSFFIFSVIQILIILLIFYLGADLTVHEILSYFSLLGSFSLLSGILYLFFSLGISRIIIFYRGIMILGMIFLLQLPYMLKAFF